MVEFAWNSEAAMEDARLFRRAAGMEPLARKCHACRCRITFPDVVRANPRLDEDWLAKLWENDKIEFLCCMCLEKHENAGRAGFPFPF